MVKGKATSFYLVKHQLRWEESFHVMMNYMTKDLDEWYTIRRSTMRYQFLCWRHESTLAKIASRNLKQHMEFKRAEWWFENVRLLPKTTLYQILVGVNWHANLSSCILCVKIAELTISSPYRAEKTGFSLSAWGSLSIRLIWCCFFWWLILLDLILMLILPLGEQFSGLFHYTHPG